MSASCCRTLVPRGTAPARARGDGLRAAARPPQPARAGLPRFLREHAGGSLRSPAPATLEVGATGDAFEREADHVADRVAERSAAPAPGHGAGHSPSAAPAGGAARRDTSPIARALGSTGRPLDAATRGDMERRFGTELGDVRVHTGAAAARLAGRLGATAFTHGRDIFFGRGAEPGANALTAHELAHVVQQRGGLGEGSPLGPLSACAGDARVQCSFSGTYLIPGRRDGAFEIDLQTRQGALAAPPTQSGLDGYIRFVPAPGAPNSNVIAMTQIARATDLAGADVPAASVPAAQAARGALGTPGLRTAEDPLQGIAGGFATDVHHRPHAAAPGVPRGSFLSPRYNFQPAPAGTIGVVGQTQQPAQYGGGTGGVVGQTPGFKRSDDPADIRSAVMYDFPGTSAAANVDLRFETAALGEDTMITYGVVNWGFGLRAGRVVDERLNVDPGESPTFREALERHRDFYVHEPVIFYFPFASAALGAAEAAKIDRFTAYLARNPDVEMSLEGYADQVGGASAYNLDLSLQRAQAVEAALLARGIAAARINAILIGRGASTAATTNAGTGDQGGTAAIGADQRREANRWANRRVVLSFAHVPAAGP